MIPNRESSATSPNAELEKQRTEETQSNLEWLAQQERPEGVLLLGGTSVTDFRLRVAQSGLRGDLTPSHWSMCGLLTAEGSRVLTVPLTVPDVSVVPATNAVQDRPLSDFDDPTAWPNIGVVRFAAEMATIVESAMDIAKRRTIIDLPSLVLDWLGYAWEVSDAPNPLAASAGIPSAVFVETAHAMAGVELTPGLASAASCPEAIWQAAKWWYEYYAEAPTVAVAGVDATQTAPRGRYVVRQTEAQIVKDGA